MHTTGSNTTGLAALGRFLVSVHRFRVGLTGATDSHADVYVETTPAGGRCDDLRLVIFDAQDAQIYAQKLLWGEDSFLTCQHYLRIPLQQTPENKVRIGIWDGTVPWEDLSLTAGNAFGISSAFELTERRYHMDPRSTWPQLNTETANDDPNSDPDKDGLAPTGSSASTVAGIPWWGWLSGAIVTGGVLFASRKN